MASLHDRHRQVCRPRGGVPGGRRPTAVWPGPDGGRGRPRRIRTDGASGYAGAFPEQKQSLLLVGGIAALLLLMASVNVACLLVARGAARRQEIAIRMSLGAGTARILRQSLLESLLLALAGGAAGLLTALGADRLLLAAFRWQERPIDLSPDWRVLAFGLAVSLVTGLLFGLARPFSSCAAGAWGSTRNARRRPASAPARRWWWRKWRSRW